MKPLGNIFCRNFTCECYFKINFNSLKVEIIYDFDDTHPDICHLTISSQFAHSMKELLFEIEPDAYYRIRKSVISRMQICPRTFSDNIYQYQAQST